VIPLWTLLLACQPPLRGVSARAGPGGIDVQADAPLDGIALLDGSGAAVIRRHPPVPTDAIWLDVPWDPAGTYRVVATSRGVEVTVPVGLPPAGTVFARIEAPFGQDPRDLHPGDRLDVAVIGGSVPIGLDAIARVDGTVAITWDGATEAVPAVAGQRITRVRTLGSTPVDAAIGDVAFTVSPVALSAGEAASELAITGLVFPAGPDGSADRARSDWTVAIPSQGWDRALRWLDVGARPSDAQAAYAWEAVRVGNTGDAALNVLVSSRIVDGSGRAAAAFRPRLRDADGELDGVRALIRVPARSEATAILPVWVDRDALIPGEYRDEVAILPLGSAVPLAELRAPIFATRGSAVAEAAFAGSVAAALAGATLAILRVRGWLRDAATSDLTTIALFASLQLVVGIGSQLFATVATTVIGPFAPVITGLLEDATRAALLATLITLLPRPGVAALELLVGTLLRMLALGAFSPLDAVYTAASILWLEGALWLFGLTRSGAWREQSATARWLRLSAGLATASVLQAGTALAVHVVLFRLFYAPWYVALDLALPSFAYVVVACRLAVPFADSLRRIER
jgi:hypothetical protein